MKPLTGKKKEDFLNSIAKEDGGWYFAIYCPKTKKGTDLGYIRNRKTLESKVLAFAAKHGYPKVDVIWGENIMNVDEGELSFDVGYKIS